VQTAHDLKAHSAPAFRNKAASEQQRIWIWLFAATLVCASSAQAQSTRAIAASGQVLFAPATYLGRSMSKEAPPDAVPPADPHWLAGMWSLRGVFERQDPKVKPPFRSLLAGKPAPNAPGAPGSADASQLCVPTAFFGAGAGYPTLIIQTRKQITIINEENHRTRFIYLDRKFPKVVRPSYSGYAVGHWEGDTLVIETRGLRPRQGSTALPDYRVIERIRKINNGRQLRQEVTFLSSAYLTPSSMVVLHNWRPDLRILEEICEEFSDPYNKDYYK
jgi:hypothetical protein